MRIHGIPDIGGLSRGGRTWRVTGRDWSGSTVDQWNQVQSSADRNHVLDVSNIDFIALFEWVTTVALIERLIAGQGVHSFEIDFVGESNVPLLSPTAHRRARRPLGFILPLDSLRHSERSRR
jgi:hypothetical protein